MKLTAILFSILLLSCGRKEIAPDDITIIAGLYTDKVTGKYLDGDYFSVTDNSPRNEKGEMIYDEIHRSEMTYTNGVPTGEWNYSYNGDVIQDGKYINEPNLKEWLIKKTNCNRVDISLWREGGQLSEYNFITINLIEPLVTDSITIENVQSESIKKLKEKYKLCLLEISTINSDTSISLRELRFKTPQNQEN